MWLFGRNKGTSYKPVQRQVSITTTQEGPSDRGDRYSTLVNSPTSFPSSSGFKEDDSASSFDQFNSSSGSLGQREPMDPCTWSSVTSPGFTSRVVNQANSSPLKEFNNGMRNPLNRSMFSGSPNRHLKLGQLPYSSWRQRQNQATSPLQFPSSPSRRSRSRYNDNGTVFVRIMPVDPEKSLLSPIPGSPVNLPNLSGDNFSRSPPNGGLGGIPQTVLSAKFQRLWPSTNPIDRALRMAPSPNSPSPGILEALANRKRTRVTDVYIDKTTTPMRSSMLNTDDSPNKGSKRVKFLPEDRNNRSLSMVPLHNLHGHDDGSMTSESILEQMNQTEKRFLPDEDTPASIRMLQKKKSGVTSRSTMQTSPFKKKRSPNGISIVEKDPKDDRFCTCTECYEEAAGVSSLIQNTTSNRNNSFLQSGTSKKSVKFNLSQTEISPAKSMVNKGTETDVLAREVIITKSPVPSGGVIDMAMYKADKKRRAERLRKILSLDSVDGPVTKDDDNGGNKLPVFGGASTETPNTTAVATSSSLPVSSTATTATINPAPEFSFGLTKDAVASNSLNDPTDPNSQFVSSAFPSGQNTSAPPFGQTPTTTNNSTPGFSFGPPKDPVITSTISKDPPVTAQFTSAFSSSQNTTTSASPFGQTSTTAAVVPGFSFGSAKEPVITSTISKDPVVTTSQLTSAAFSSGQDTTISASPFGLTSTAATNNVVHGFSFGSAKDPLITSGLSKDPTVTTSQLTSTLFSSGQDTTTSSSPFGETSTTTASNSAQGFSFDPSKDSAVTLNLSKDPTVTTSQFVSPTFSSGQNTTSASSFGQTSTPATNNSAPGFNFGPPKDPVITSALPKDPTVTTSQFAAPTFSFGQNTAASASPFGQTSTTTNNSGQGFSFDAPKEPIIPSTLPKDPAVTTSQHTSAAFSFGSNTTASASPFGQTSTTTTNNPGQGFSFDAPKDPIITSTLSQEPTVTSPFTSAAFSFGQNTTTSASPFGQTSTTTNSTFGQPNSVPTFGQSQNNNQSSSGFAFGSNNSISSPPNPILNIGVPAQLPSLFGGANTSNAMSSPFGSTSSTQANNIFNSNAGATSNVFGGGQNQVTSPSSTSFGSGTTGNTFGQASVSSTAGNTFGQVPGISSTGNTFGQVPASSTTGNTFGQAPASSSSSAFGQAANNQPPAAIFKPNASFGNAGPTNNSFAPFGQQPSSTSNSGFGSGSFSFGSATTNPTTASSNIFGSAPAPVASPPPNFGTAASQPYSFGSSTAPTFGSPATGTNNSVFGASATPNPPAFGSQTQNQPSFGQPSGGAFNFQTPSQPPQQPQPQAGGFSFAAAASRNTSNNNAQGLFQFGQQAQAQAQSPQGGFNFAAQTNFAGGMAPPGAQQPNFSAGGMPQAGAPTMFSLGSANSTPSARRRDARTRRYR